MNKRIKYEPPIVIDHTVNGKCSNCGDCCTDMLPLKMYEVIKIKEYLKNHPEIKQHRHIYDDVVHVTCPFRDHEKKLCTIYPVRPEVCQDYICSMSVEAIDKKRTLHLTNASYNSMKKSSAVSLHTLFFDDIEREVMFWSAYFDTKDMNEFKEKMIKLNPYIVRKNLITFE